jgi:hypothetical protein
LNREGGQFWGNKDLAIPVYLNRNVFEPDICGRRSAELAGSTEEAKVIGGIRFAAAVLILTVACFAQEGLTVRAKGKQTWPAAEAQKTYRSACAVVQRELGATPSVAPSVTLVLGADKNEVEFGQQEVRLKKCDRNAFAQGVVMVAFGNLMLDRRIAMARRAVTWADVTEDVGPAGH